MFSFSNQSKVKYIHSRLRVVLVAEVKSIKDKYIYIYVKYVNKYAIVERIILFLLFFYWISNYFYRAIYAKSEVSLLLFLLVMTNVNRVHAS